MIRKVYKAIHWRFERSVHSFLLKRKIKAGTLKNLKLHFGCGGHKIPEMINIDFKLNSITDFQMDLSIPNEIPANSTLELFSNAFFEHLFRGIRIDHLKKVKSILNKDGFFCYIGIPYFKETVKHYLDNDNFCNLDLVFRFTHGGGPIEQMNIKSKKDIFLAHLHKSLYDENELEKCVLDAGFKRYKIFKYSHPGEVGYKINLGFYGKKNDNASEDTMKEECIMFLKKFDNEKIIVDTIEFII
jgi:predicted SAM-dependent methyltransferase